MPINLLPPRAILRQLGQRVQAMRLDRGLTRVALSALCDVPESTIKRFETTGEIGTKSMVLIFISLDAVDHISRLAEKSAPLTMDELLKPPRQRGRRSDAGSTKDSTP